MKTFSQFVAEAYDADLMRSASVRTTGAGLCEYSRKILEEKGLLYYI